MYMLCVYYSCRWCGPLWRLDGEFLKWAFWNPGGASCVALSSPACALAMDVLGVCGSLGMLVLGGGGVR